jgi:DNA-directed RNA polymerase specialized sigma24 family protein
MYSSDVVFFNDVISQHYDEYQRKLKQWCYLNAATYDEDVFQDTYLKCADLISRKGLKDKTEQGALNYFFIAFKKNTYQAYLQKSKKSIDENCDVFSLVIEDEDVREKQELQAQRVDSLIRNILEDIRSNFTEIDYHIFRLRYLFQKDGKYLNYKQIKQITKIADTRKRLMTMNAFIREKYGNLRQIKD